MSPARPRAFDRRSGQRLRTRPTAPTSGARLATRSHRVGPVKEAHAINLDKLLLALRAGKAHIYCKKQNGDLWSQCRSSGCLGSPCSAGLSSRSPSGCKIGAAPPRPKPRYPGSFAQHPDFATRKAARLVRRFSGKTPPLRGLREPANFSSNRPSNSRARRRGVVSRRRRRPHHGLGKAPRLLPLRLCAGSKTLGRPLHSSSRRPTNRTLGNNIIEDVVYLNDNLTKPSICTLIYNQSIAA